MNNTQKKNAIKRHVKDMMKDSQKHMQDKLEKVLSSGCIDIDDWDPEHAPMIIPKLILCALLESESYQYDIPKSHSNRRALMKEKKNIAYFI
jgi:hypothetical protein